MFLHTKPYGGRWTSPLVGSPMSDIDGPLVDYDKPGASRSGLTSKCFLVTTGMPVSTMATVEWCNNSQGLCDDDDDDDNSSVCHD